MKAQTALLEHRYLFLAACFSGLYFTCGMQQHVRVDLFPSDYNEVFVSIRTPVDNSLDQTNAVMLGIDTVLALVCWRLFAAGYKLKA